MLRNENSFSRRWFFVGVGIGYCLLIVIMRSGANTIKLYLAITNEALDFDIGIPSIHNLESTKLPPSTQCWFIWCKLGHSWSMSNQITYSFSNCCKNSFVALIPGLCNWFGLISSLMRSPWQSDFGGIFFAEKFHVFVNVYGIMIKGKLK